MKAPILFIFLFFFSFHLMAQKDCSDAVHPTNYRASILNCCIKDIKEGNIVVYAKDGVINEIEAVAVNLNKAYYALKEPNDSIRNRVLLNNNPEAYYADHPYEYHQYLYKKAQNKQTMGIALCVVGGGMLIGGIAIIDQKARKYNYFDPDDDKHFNGSGVILTLLGAAGLGVGIPTAITNGIKKRKSKHAMEEIKRQRELSINLTHHGLGLVFTF